MSWFSSQWNRWNQATPSAWSDVEWLEVVLGRQRYVFVKRSTLTNHARYQVTLPNIDEPLTLKYLRQELASIFNVPSQGISIVFQGMVLKDDRVSLQDYGLTTGSRIQLLLKDTQPQQHKTAHTMQHTSMPPNDVSPVEAAQMSADAAPSGPTWPGFGSSDAAAHVNQSTQAAPGAQNTVPPMSKDQKHLQQIEQVTQHCRAELVPELERFENSIQKLPDSHPGTLQSEPEDSLAPLFSVTPHRLPYEQRKLSELLLRELLKLDDVPTDKDEVRMARKSTVKEVQGYLERVDTAWNTATKEKGIVSDV